MRLINLKFRGISEAEENFDFSNKAQGLIAIDGRDEGKIKTALSFAFYGDEDATKFILPFIVEMRFVLGYDEYYIYRKLTRTVEGNPLEEVKLTNFKGEPVCDQTKEGVNTYLAEKIGLSKNAFDTLILIDRNISLKLAKDTLTRETFVADGLGALATSTKVLEMLESLTSEEKILSKSLDKLDAVSKNEIDSLEAVVDHDKSNLEEIRTRMAKLNDELQLASKYKGEMDLLYDASAKLETLNEKKPEMEALANRLAKSKEAKDISNVFSAYGEILGRLDEEGINLDALKEKIAVLDEKIAKGEKSLLSLGDKFADLVLTGEELQKALLGLITEGKNSPDKLKVDEMLLSYYKEIDEKAKALITESNKLSDEAVSLTTLNDHLVQKKREIRDPSDYKQAVQEGAIIEGRIKIVEESIQAAQDRKEALIVDRAGMVEQVQKIDKFTAGSEEELSTLDKEIKGKYKSLQEAVNADVFYKQRIYSKHLLVSRNEVELDAVNQKIESVKGANEGYKQKLSVLNDRKAAIVKHRARLQEKLILLNEKMLEYMSENRLRDVSEKVEYGSHCPICDGFVSVKKPLPLKDTKALDNQIVAVGKDIDKDEQALMEAEAAIGQYDAAVTMGAQYMLALIETRDSKQEFIDNILKEYNVSSIEELFEKTNQAIEKSKLLQQRVDRYKELEKEYQKQTEARKILEASLKVIDTEKIPVEDNIIKSLSQEVADMKTKYVKFKKFYGNESATDLLRKVEVLDKEYEALEKEFETRYERLSAIAKDKDNLFVEANKYANRSVPLKIEDKEYSREEVTIKAFSEYMTAIIAEIDNNKQKKEKLKVQISAVKKVAEMAKEERAALKEKALTLEATINATRDTSKTIYADYEERFASLGVKGKMDLDRLIMGDLEAEKAADKLVKFDEELAAAKEAVRVYQEGSKNNAVYFETSNMNTMELAELKEREEKAIISLGDSMSKKKNLSDRYDEISRLNKMLATVQSRIKGIKDLEPAIKEGAIIAKDFAELIYEKTNSIVRTISSGRYKVEKGAEGSVLLALFEKGKVRTENLTREEKMLLPLSLSAAYNEAMISLLGGEIVPILKVATAECDKASLAPLYEYSKSRDLIVVTEDENAYFRAISKL